MRYALILVMAFIPVANLWATDYFINEFPDEAWFDEVAYGNDMWVVVGASGMRYSRNALDWEFVTDWDTFGDRFKGITYGGGFFVASGNSLYDVGQGTVAVSTDGINWEIAPKPPIEGNWVNRHDKIVFNGGHWVMAGSNVLHSTSLYEWTEVLGDGGTALAYGNGRFVFISWSGNKYTSPDGIQWTDHGEDPNLTDQYGDGVSLAYGDGVFVAVSDRIFTSENGIDWKECARPSDVLYGVTYGRDRFLAVGNNALVCESMDGSTWVEDRWTETEFGYAQLDQVTYGMDIFLSVGGLSGAGVMVAPKGGAVDPNATSYAAVEIEFNTSFGRTYQVERSQDQQEWEIVERGIIGTGKRMQLFYSTRSQPTYVWRVIELLE